jgi:signal transduction histidine kinase
VAARIRVRHRIDEAAIAVVVPAELRIVTEATALETVLGNLLDNAVKYSNQPVSVSVRGVVKPRGRLEITVTDRGIGVPEADLRRIFERFYRSSTEDVRTRRGTGLGLYVASSLVKNLGGTLTADSPGRGLGTTLRFELPIGELDRPPNRRPPRAMETGPL